MYVRTGTRARTRNPVAGSLLGACAQSRVGSGQNIPENAGRNITTTTDGNHQVGVEFLEDGIGGLLAQLVHLIVGDVELLDHFGRLK